MKKKIMALIAMISVLISIEVNCFAHSGKTDKNGGHKDNQNKSGLGSYHYHCGGYPAHLHPSGVCPYSSSSSSSSTTTKKSTNNSTTTTTTKSTATESTATKTKNIEVEKVEIMNEVKTLKLGENKKLEVVVSPDNATNKELKWTSSNEKIIMVDNSGNIKAKGNGTCNITVESNNGKKDTFLVTVYEEEEENTNAIIKKWDSSREESPVVGLIGISILGGLGFWGYKKSKG